MAPHASFGEGLPPGSSSLFLRPPPLYVTRVHRRAHLLFLPTARSLTNGPTRPGSTPIAALPLRVTTTPQYYAYSHSSPSSPRYCSPHTPPSFSCRASTPRSLLPRRGYRAYSNPVPGRRFYLFLHLFNYFRKFLIVPKEGDLSSSLVDTPDSGKEFRQDVRSSESFVNLSFVICRIERTPRALFAPINGWIAQLVTFA